MWEITQGPSWLPPEQWPEMGGTYSACSVGAGGHVERELLIRRGAPQADTPDLLLRMPSEVGGRSTCRRLGGAR